jgi:hypothetical protein
VNKGAWNKREHRTAERQEYRIRCSDAARPGRQGCDDQTEKLFELPHMSRGWRCKVLGALPTCGRAFPEWRVYSDFREAMSMEKRYFTSDLSILS